MDWDHNRSFSFDLDAYERKKKRRGFDELRIPQKTRHEILLDECGYSMSTIMKVSLEVKSVREQRAKTSKEAKRLLKRKDAIKSIIQCISRSWKIFLRKESTTRANRDDDDTTSLESTSQYNEDVFEEEPI